MSYSKNNVKDFLSEIIEERTKVNPDFPKMVEESYKKRVKDRKAILQNKKIKIVDLDF